MSRSARQDGFMMPIDAASDTAEPAPTAGVRRALVTGGAGFIGSHLVEQLLQRGAAVTVVDDFSTGRQDNLAHLRPSDRLTVVEGSVGDRELIAPLIEQSDHVYHLAAAVGVALIASRPISTIERNVYPTELVLAELSRQWQAGRAVKLFLASTSEVYGKNPKERWCEEDDLVFGATTRPRWSYGASKAIDEFLALAYRRETGLPVVIGRFFNVVGPRQTGAYGMVLPRFVAAAVRNEPLIVHDDGRQERCFAHVRDVVGAVLTLMDHAQAAGRVYNIGGDQPISILELARQVIRIAGSSSTIEFRSYARAYDDDFEDVRRRVPDLSRLRATIGYEPQVSLEETIAELVALERNTS